MARYDLTEFLQKTQEQDHQEGLFELESDRMLEINLNGEVWTKTGSMVAYVGGIKFEREGILEQGVGKLLKNPPKDSGVA